MPGIISYIHSEVEAARSKTNLDTAEGPSVITCSLRAAGNGLSVVTISQTVFGALSSLFVARKTSLREGDPKPRQQNLRQDEKECAVMGGNKVCTVSLQTVSLTSTSFNLYKCKLTDRRGVGQERGF